MLVYIRTGSELGRFNFKMIVLKRVALDPSRTRRYPFESYIQEKEPVVVRRNASRTHLKHHLKISMLMWTTGKPWLKNKTSDRALFWVHNVTFGSSRVKEAENKRQLHKSRVNDNSVISVLTNLVCRTCHGLFHGQIGLFSHICTYKP